LRATSARAFMEEIEHIVVFETRLMGL